LGRSGGETGHSSVEAFKSGAGASAMASTYLAELRRGFDQRGGCTPFTVPGVPSAAGLAAPRDTHGVVIAFWVHNCFLLGSGFSRGFGPQHEGPVSMSALVEPLISGIQSQHRRTATFR
jgi:hypothetical protein